MWIRKFLKFSPDDVGGGGTAVVDALAAGGAGDPAIVEEAGSAALTAAGAPASDGTQANPGTDPPELEPLSPTVISAAEEAFTAIGLPSDIVESARAWMDKGLVMSQAELDTIDAADRAKAETELKALWGKGKYLSNIKAINKYVAETLKPGVADVIQSARHADGHAIGNDPAVLQRLLGPALKAQPAELNGDLDTQIETIESFMRTNRAAYNRDEPLQSRYRQLLGERAERA